MNSQSGRTEESQVFLLRVWWDSGRRGRLLDLLSGEVFEFACWPELVAALTASLRSEERSEEEMKN